MLGERTGVAVVPFHEVFCYDHHVACASPKLFWLLAPGARPRRHDAAFVVVAVVVRSTLMLTLLLWLTWTNQKKKQFRVHLKKESLGVSGPRARALLQKL